MGVIVFSIHFDEVRAEVSADYQESVGEDVVSPRTQYSAAIFRYKDQVNVK
jgi:hypothetical protein